MENPHGRDSTDDSLESRSKIDNQGRPLPGVLVLDATLSIGHFTPEVAEILHLDNGDIGRSIADFCHHLDGDSLINELRKTLSTGQQKASSVTDKQGKTYALQMIPTQCGEPDGGIMLTFSDFDGLQSPLHEFERFKLMAESAVEAIAFSDCDGRFAYVNPVMCDLLGYRREELQRMTFMDIDVHHDHERYRENLEKATLGELKVFTSEFRRKDSGHLPMELSVNSIEFRGQRYLCAYCRDISDRRDVEMELRLQHMAIESALNGILITDATAEDNPITYANPGFSDLTGYSSEEIVGRNCRFLQGENTDRKMVAQIRRAIETGVPVRTTILNYKKDGTPFWNDLNITPVRNEMGELVNFVGIQHDITEQIEAQSTATRNAGRFTAILDTAAEGIYGIDTQGLCTFCNQSALNMLGYRHESDVLGKQMHALIHHTRPDGTHMTAEECLIYQAWHKHKTIHVSDEWFWNRDGNGFPVEYWSRPFIHDGELRGAVVSFQDISERLLLSSRLEQMGKMVDASHDAIIDRELNGRILSWNFGATKLYGFDAEEAIGEITHQLLNTVNAGVLKDIDRSLLDTGEWVGVLEHTNRDGEKIIVSSRHQLLKLSSGQQHVLEINRDITEQRRIQKELERANEAAKEASAAKSAFLANMSHELRTPMTAVLGFADILRLESDAPEHVERVDTIKRNGEYLLALLNDILDLSKIEAGKLNIERETIDIRKVIEDVRSLMSVRASEEGVPLKFEWKSKVPREITVDQVRVRQILVNLISNAIKFTDHGEVRVTIDVDQRDDAAVLRLAVKDTGIGMTPLQQQQLFTPFSQPSQENSRKFGGTGLGLSISKRLAEAMGGEIKVESEWGIGSRFTLELPLTSEQMQTLVSAERDDQTAADTSGEPTALPHFDARILLADDRRDVWRIGKYFLEKCGAAVTVVEDGQQAVDATKQAASDGKPFDLILMDMQMPVMTGRQAVHAIRKAGFTIPIIALTADAMEGERDACIQIGCDEYFPKPIHGVRLMNMIATLIQSKNPTV